ncbi:small integral membrane protein 9 [Perognathus longimembris pacificus]|uniref:small integral membrane protein 9 n=1 Tax=Perognathus longimembris pacificus TaxID=214514 RepID=UPI002019B04F|nr:small integral membrane protein 9 [Perognathus longimembris pacificus]
MELKKHLYIVFLLCMLTLLLLEIEASSSLSNIRLREKSRSKSHAKSVFAIRMNVPDFERHKIYFSGKHRSWIWNFKNYLRDLIRNSIPSIAIFAFLMAVAVIGTLCCFT